jgi:uncharacterized protein YggE
MRRMGKMRIGFSMVMIVAAIVALVGAWAWPRVLAQAPTPTAAAGATPTNAATARATLTTAATARATSTITATEDVTATVAATATAVLTPTIVATEVATPTVAATPTSAAAKAPATEVAPGAAQVVDTRTAAPAARTIQLTGLLELPPESAPRTISVVGEGVVRTAPDIAYAIIGVETISDTVKLAADKNARLMAAVTGALKAQGIAAEDIQTSSYNVYTERQPSIEGGAAGQALYHVSNTARIAVRELDTVSAVLDAAIEAGANSIGGVSFSIADPEPLVAQAREKAMADALAKAGDLARLANVRLGMVMQVSEPMISGGAIAIAESLDRGGSGPSISPGQIEVSDQVQVVYVIE